MKKRKSPTFASALVEANRELAKALKRRTQCQAELADLNVEIPALQRTIAALQGQVEGKATVYRVESDSTLTPIPGGVDNGVPKAGLKFTDVVPLPEISPEMGSVPATTNTTPARELTEDELLVMPTAEDVIKSAPKKADDATDPFTDNL